MKMIIASKLALLTIFTGLSIMPELAAGAAQKTVKFKFKLTGSEIDTISAITNQGAVYPGVVSGSTVTVSVPSSKLSGTSFFASASGRLIGPVIVKSGTRGSIFLAKKLSDAAGKELKTVKVTLSERVAAENFVAVKKLPKGSIFNKSKITLSSITALGLNLPQAAQQRIGRHVSQRAVSGDLDSDGIVDSLDADVDGDGITNMADTDNEGASVDVPFTALYLPMSETVNWHIDSSNISSRIDAVIGGENKFSVAFFFTAPRGSSSTITGGYVVCGSSLEYCKPTSGSSTGTGVYSGFSEGNQSLIGQLWSSISTGGGEYSLESFTIGGSSDTAYAASIQPRVGTSQFRPGDNYRVDFTNSSGSVVARKTLTLPPYFLTVPALRAYNTTSNDSASDVLVSYASSSEVGMLNSNPIVLASSGDFSGKLNIQVWRLQRQAVAPTESGDYKDQGRLSYGVTINNNSGEFTCGGLYSNLSSTLTEVPSTGTGGSFQSSQGAVLWPLLDSADDYTPSNGSDSTTVGNNTLRFTVNLSECLTRNSLSAGIHQVQVTAAGADTGHGSNRAAQTIYVQIP